MNNYKNIVEEIVLSDYIFKWKLLKKIIKGREKFSIWKMLFFYFVNFMS
jgi:hypothetical protein